MVEQAWTTDTGTNPNIQVWKKIQQTRVHLLQWNKSKGSNPTKQIKELEDRFETLQSGRLDHKAYSEMDQIQQKIEEMRHVDMLHWQKWSRLKTDNALVAFELNHHLKSSTRIKDRCEVIKLDMSKAYDREAERRSRIRGVAVAKQAPRVSHLLFADDTLVFCKANEAQIRKVRPILNVYERASSQAINFKKSSMVVGGRMSELKKVQLAAILEVRLVLCHDRYLGLPAASGRSRGYYFKGSETSCRLGTSVRINNGGLLVAL
ncbi:UNVERIFIED_CONTAM: hypothetical protein Sradi_2093200 [Sesamum radiatum]|uniref:Reverse transcriptase domain-containing protein n=1 Tax=Sesamum radiatum TaxID=300843 RepID=A0AAW2TJA9_SESRA